MLALSAAFNGYANAQHSPVAWAGWLVGLAVPVIVLVLVKVCGEKYRAGQKAVARFAGASGVALLLLSVWHCSQSIALLTGSPVALALPMAVAIDCGLVACEAALISEPRDEQPFPAGPHRPRRSLSTSAVEKVCLFGSPAVANGTATPPRGLRARLVTGKWAG